MARIESHPANCVDEARELLTGELENIAALAPLDEMPASHLAEILAGAELVFFRHGKIICHPDIPDSSPCLWLVRQGSVRALPFDDATADAISGQLLGIGALLPLESVLTGARPWHTYVAAEDSFLWAISGAVLQQMLLEPAVLRWIALRLQESNAGLRDAVGELLRSRQVGDQALALPVRLAASAGAIWVSADTSIGEVAALMADRQRGSAVIGSPDCAIGIVTQTDLTRRAMATGLAYSTPVAAIMTAQPAMIDGDATVLDAGVEMARRRCRHLLVREPDGPVVSVVSERDIFRIQQQGIVQVFHPIDTANSVEEIATLAGRIRDFGERVFRQGMEVSQFTRLVSSINDRLTQRLLAVIAGQTHPERRFCWLAFGSEGREEQGFVTDQDNGLVFVPLAPANIEAERAGYLEMAQRMNDALDRCGFDRCKGNIMAGNVEWCLTLDEWKTKFSQWIGTTTPSALLNATIFFDLRGIFGDGKLAELLRDHFTREIRGNTICLKMLAAMALAVRPPIGKWNRFVTDDSEERTIDLKTHGSRLFVDPARIFALANGVHTANTEGRLRAVGKHIQRAPTAIEGDIAAFRFIQAIRLRRQLDSLKDGKPANRVDPYSLSDLDQRMLRESMRQAQSLQDRLKLNYQQ